MDSATKLLLSIAAVLLVVGTVRSQLTLTVDQQYVKTYRDLPQPCQLNPRLCGNIWDLDQAIQLTKDSLDLPPPPLSVDGRKVVLPFADDYEVCPYIRRDDIWISFQWGAQAQNTTYMRFLDSFQSVICRAGICDEHMYYNGWKFGCVAVWKQRTYNVLWPATDDYVRQIRQTNSLKCAKSYCLVRLRLDYPESCKCAQLQSCGQH